MNTTLKSLIVGGISGCLLVFACEKRSSEKESTEVAQDINEAKFDGKSEEDASFIQEAAKINLCEIRISQLAEKKSSDIKVKELATSIIERHKKLYNITAELANKKGVTIPDSISRDEVNGYSDLKDKTGADFDKKFLDIMVDNHEKAIDKFESVVSKDDTELDIKTYATDALPHLRSHLDKTKTIQLKFDNKNM